MNNQRFNESFRPLDEEEFQIYSNLDTATFTDNDLADLTNNLKICNQQQPHPHQVYNSQNNARLIYDYSTSSRANNQQQQQQQLPQTFKEPNLFIQSAFKRPLTPFPDSAASAADETNKKHAFTATTFVAAAATTATTGKQKLNTNRKISLPTNSRKLSSQLSVNGVRLDSTAKTSVNYNGNNNTNSKKLKANNNNSNNIVQFSEPLTPLMINVQADYEDLDNINPTIQMIDSSSTNNNQKGVAFDSALQRKQFFAQFINEIGKLIGTEFQVRSIQLMNSFSRDQLLNTRFFLDQIKVFCPSDKNFLDCAISTVALLRIIINQKPSSSNDKNRKPSISETTRTKLKEFLLKRSPHLHSQTIEGKSLIVIFNQQLLNEVEAILLQMKNESDFFSLEKKMFSFSNNPTRN